MEIFLFIRDFLNMAWLTFKHLFKSEREVIFDWISTLNDVEDVFSQCIAMGGSFRLPWLINNVEVTVTKLDRDLERIELEARSKSIRKHITELREVLKHTWAASRQNHIYMAFDNGNKTFSSVDQELLEKFAKLQRENAERGKTIIDVLRIEIEKRIVKQ